MPEEDSHLSDQTRSQAHPSREFTRALEPRLGPSTLKRGALGRRRVRSRRPPLQKFGTAARCDPPTFEACGTASTSTSSGPRVTAPRCWTPG